MDRDPDVKRARLDQPASFHSPPSALGAAPAPTPPPSAQPSLPTSGLAPPYPEPHQPPPLAHHSTAAPTHSPASHQYPPPTLPPPASQHVQSHHPASGPAYLEPQADPRGLQSFHHSAPPPPHPSVPPGPPSFPDGRPGYGSLNQQQQPRSYRSESGSSRPSSAPSQAGLGDLQRGPGPTPPGSEPSNSQMDHASHPHGPPVYQSGPMDPHVNGGQVQVPNGMPSYSAQPTEQYAVAVGPSPNFPQTPIATTYAQPSYSSGPTNFGIPGRRKMVRAQQACNNCRQRKQKCDENRPCSYCKQEGAACEYREVPPPKADKNMQILMDMVSDVKASIDMTTKKQEELTQQLATLSAIVQEQAGLSSSSNSTQPQTTIHSRRTVTIDSGATAIIPDDRKYSITTNTMVATPATVETSLSNGSVKSDMMLARVTGTAIQPVAEVSADETPGPHSTGAHHLMRWPKIQTFYTKAGVDNEAYVREQEESQGVLRLYGRGFSGAKFKDGKSRPHNAQSDYPSHPSPPDDEEYGSSFAEHHPKMPHLGGLNPNGSLRLDETTVKRLHDSYMKHMWIMHPIFCAQSLKTIVERFIAHYSPSQPNYSSPQGQSTSPFAVPSAPNTRAGAEAYSGVPSKRKYPSDASHSSYQTTNAHEVSYSLPPKRTPDHSINNAIVLLVLALGKILEYDDFLLGDEQTIHISSYIQQTQGSPPNSMYKASPTHSGSIHPSVASPSFDPVRSGAESHSSSAERFVPERQDTALNVDRIPGLAYYAAAADMLGNLIGGRDLPYCQAYLLAGLYMGQLGLVLQSASWIHLAAAIIGEWRGKFENDLMGMVVDERENGEIIFEQAKTDTFADLLLFNFWSALSLESDIRAELDHLPNSGLTSMVEDRVGRHLRLPSVLVGVPDGNILELHYSTLAVAETDVLFHYWAQISIRRILNRTHKWLYGLDKADRKEKERKEGLRLDEQDPLVLWLQLKNWRRILPNHLRWNDSDPPASDILVARLRAKYYGAAYVINRKLLHTAIHTIKPEGNWTVVLEKLNQMSPGANSNTSAELEQVVMEENLSPHELLANACSVCLKSALASTIALDGLAPGTPQISKRPLITNIHGTAAAQFSNCLVLANAYLSWLSPLVPEEQLRHAMQRTIALHARLSPLSPVFKINFDVLRAANEEVLEEMQRRYPQRQWRGSPRTRGGSMSAGPGTPRFVADNASTTSSFSTR